MSAHAYHPACGCSACCDDELADERRDDYIAQFSAPIAKRLLLDDDACWGYLTDLSEDAQRGVLEDAGRFFARFHEAQTDEAMAQAGYTLYRSLLPYMEAAAKAQAESEVAADYDRMEAA